MTISLPDEWRERLEARARANGFASVEDYLLSLAQAEELEDDTIDGTPGPSELTPRNREELERMLDEGMKSGPVIRVTPEFWDERRRELERRMAARKGRMP
jgi:hypothetical protein